MQLTHNSASKFSRETFYWTIKWHIVRSRRVVLVNILIPTEVIYNDNSTKCSIFQLSGIRKKIHILSYSCNPQLSYYHHASGRKNTKMMKLVTVHTHTQTLYSKCYFNFLPLIHSTSNQNYNSDINTGYNLCTNLSALEAFNTVRQTKLKKKTTKNI